MIDRRTLVQTVTGAAALSPFILSGRAGAQPGTSAPIGPVQEAHPATERPALDMRRIPASWFGKEQVAILIYDKMTALDVVGPQYMLSGLMGATIHMVARSDKPIVSDSGLILTPTATFETCPRDLDLLLVGGGLDGTLAAMRDEATVGFLADRGSRAKWVTSVCTGSLLLGQAGLLHGYRATSHWIGRPLLSRFGAIEVDQRLVFDRNRATGAGVSAGIDLGLALVDRLRPRDLAQTMQLLAEYAPEPPLAAGTPDTAPAEVTAGVRARLAGFVSAVEETSHEARR